MSFKLRVIYVQMIALLFGCLMVFELHPPFAQASQDRKVSNGITSLSSGDYAIAYVAPSRDNQQIRLINPDGSEDRLLWQVPPSTDRANGIGELSWRSDASELAFDSAHDWQRSMNLRDIYSVAANGLYLRRLTRPPSAEGASTRPNGTVTFRFASLAVGDVQLYIEGADRAIPFVSRIGYSYQITQTLPDLGDQVRQSIRLYDPTEYTSNWCNYDEVAWVDVVPGKVTHSEPIYIGGDDDHTCPQTLRPAWLFDSNELIYLYSEPTIASFQEESNIWRVGGDTPPTRPGTRLLDYSQFLFEGRVILAQPGRTIGNAEQMLVAVRPEPGSSYPIIFRALLGDAKQREIFDLGTCDMPCQITGLAWLPDGSGFVFSRYWQWAFQPDSLAPMSKIYRYTFADKQLTELYSILNVAIGRLDVSPDGTQIVFERSDHLDETAENYERAPLLFCPCEVWLMNNDGSNVYQLIKDGRAPTWSPVPVPDIPTPTITHTPTRTPTSTPTRTPTAVPGSSQSQPAVYLPIVQK